MTLFISKSCFLESIDSVILFRFGLALFIYKQKIPTYVVSAQIHSELFFYKKLLLITYQSSFKLIIIQKFKT
jgi:hypothetical protein